MRKRFPIFLLALVLPASMQAQSGRRASNPSPPREPVVESPDLPRPQPERLPTMPANLTVLPESILNRELMALDKGSFRLSDFNGRVLVINLWASWCGPCRAEIPDYEKVRKDYANRAVEFIGLTTEDPRTAFERVQKFARDINFRFRLGWADGATANFIMNGRNTIPQTLVIGTDGQILYHSRGYSPGQSGKRLREAIDGALSDSAVKK